MLLTDPLQFHYLYISALHHRSQSKWKDYFHEIQCKIFKIWIYIFIYSTYDTPIEPNISAL